MPGVWTWVSPADADAAEVMLLKALALDPGYARPLALLAWLRAARVHLGAPDPTAGLAAARDFADRAVAADPADPWALVASGYAHMVAREVEPGLATLAEAVTLNPSFAFAHGILGSAYSFAGLPEDGLHQIAIAARLSPRDFAVAAHQASAGMCHLVAGRYAEAVEAERKAVALAPRFGTAWRTLAAAAGLARELPLARQALAEARRLHPGLDLDWIERTHPLARPADRQRYAEGLRAAGLER